MSHLSLREHNHPEGSLPDEGTCPRCDSVYWNPRLVKMTDPRPDVLTVAILTAVLTGIVLLILVITG